MKKALAVGGGAALLAACFLRQWSLGLSAPQALAWLLLYGMVVVFLLALVMAECWVGAWAALAVAGCYGACLGIKPPLPSLLVEIFTGLATLGVLLYISVRDKDLEQVRQALVALLEGPPFRPHRLILSLLLPCWAGAWTWAGTGKGFEPPLYPRSIHPAPPDQSDFLGKAYAMAAIENPYRALEKENPERFKALVREGKGIYYQNCFQCHGDNLDGRGRFSRALNPLPANFQDPGTIAMLQESYVFWRVSKGGPGLPPSAHPWNSAMPQWEKMLKEDDIWKAILWIYNATGYAPRTWEKVEH